MSVQDECEHSVLKRYPKAVYHLRAQLERNKLMPMFGAGIGRPLGFPDWNELVARIAHHEHVQGEDLNCARGSNTSRIQMLFEYFRSREQGNYKTNEPLSAVERRIRSKWFEVILQCLYKDVRPIKDHPYLNQLLPVVRQAPLTVNFNFDDCVEELFDLELDPFEKRTDRGYETVWEPSVQYRYDRGVIYHPNGFLPRDLQRGGSNWLTFAEDSFADQMIGIQQGHFSTLMSHLFRYTSLLIGLSLDDQSLKHLLRQNARLNPGHVHYYISYRDPARMESEDRSIAARESNFSIYNLVTLALSSDEIAALGRLLSRNDDEIAFMATQVSVPKRFTYYLSGAVGGGKTTSLRYFKSLNTFDEWLEPKPPEILKAADSLTDGERATVDAWIDQQFEKKNFLVNRAELRISVVDRSVLDPIAFARDPESRARELIATYGRSKLGATSGMVLLVLGNPDTMNVRISERHKEGSVGYIADLQGRFEELWSRDGDAVMGVKIIDTVDRSVHQVVREISRAIHLSDYVEADLDVIAGRYAKQ